MTTPSHNNHNDALAVAVMVLAVTAAAVGTFFLLLMELQEGRPL